MANVCKKSYQCAINMTQLSRSGKYLQILCKITLHFDLNYMHLLLLILHENDFHQN